MCHCMTSQTSRALALIIIVSHADGNEKLAPTPQKYAKSKLVYWISLLRSHEMLRALFLLQRLLFLCPPFV